MNSRLYELTNNKQKQLTAKEEALQGSKEAIREAFQEDWQEIRVELEKEYQYIREN